MAARAPEEGAQVSNKQRLREVLSNLPDGSSASALGEVLDMAVDAVMRMHRGELEEHAGLCHAVEEAGLFDCEGERGGEHALGKTYSLAIVFTRDHVFVNGVSVPVCGATSDGARSAQPVPSRFYIRDGRRVDGNCALWWKPERSGYTTDVREAGLYTAEQAQKICDAPSSDRRDIAYPQEVVERAARLHVDLEEADALIPKEGPSAASR